MKHAIRRRAPEVILTTFLLLSLAPIVRGNTVLLLSRDQKPERVEYRDLVDLVVNPGFEATKVSITVDGERVVEALRHPYRLTINFGPRVLEHRITVTAWSANKRRVQWTETVNRGHRPLTVKLRAVDAGRGEFEAVTTAPEDDPVTKVEVWDEGEVVASATSAPYRLTVPSSVVETAFVQVTATTRSGAEAADFWSPSGDVVVESMDVRTVPLYVSVVDRDGTTRVDVDRSLFRVMDGNTEGKIVQFAKAFDQPISIALLLDASASMTYSMKDAVKAATTFVQRTLKAGDRCTVYAVRDVPRRQIELTGDKEAVVRAIRDIQPAGHTALYDAINTAVRDLEAEKKRRAIVILTDGADNDSLDTWEDVEQATRAAGIPIYFLAYENIEPTAPQDYDRMQFLATQTGGFVTLANRENLESKYEEIEKDLRAQFSIVYQVAGYAKRNEWRKVRVVIKSPRLTARTIGGYFAQ